MSAYLGKPVDFERNPIDLGPRFELRRLNTEHIEWAKAIVGHSNVFCSPVWKVCYPEGKTARVHAFMVTADYLCRHQVMSGLSFGVFDKQYKFKRPESAATGGRLYWNEDEDATEDQLIEQMDFPLVSVALAYDLIKPLDHEQLAPLVGTFPLFGLALHLLEERDPRDPATWAATSSNQVFMRNATSTRKDYEGNGVMKKMAHWLMSEAKLEGFHQIQIECFNDAVTKVWTNPPSPFTAEKVSMLDMGTYEQQDESGKPVIPFYPCKQEVCKVVVHVA